MVQLCKVDCVTIPIEDGAQLSERLLAVRGGSLAMGLIQRRPIYKEVLSHPEIEVFEVT